MPLYIPYLHLKILLSGYVKCSGYMSPEYALGGFFSLKSDVFSFGVLLLEIISGKKNNRVFHDIPNSSLVKHVGSQHSLR